MTGYLDQYGAGDERREQRVKRVVFTVLLTIAALASIFVLRINHSEKGRINDFVAKLQAKDYTAAYGMWGCTDATPCPNYSYPNFLADWGPSSRHARISNYSIHRSCACGTGVLITLKLLPGGEEKLWVELNNGVLGFAPWPTCRPKPLLCFLPV